MSGEKDEHSICLATSAEDVKLWSTKGFLLTQQFNPHSGNVSSISWSNDNNVLASTSSSAQDTICLNYINANGHSVVVEGSTGVQCASFSSDSRYVAGGNINGVVNVWEIKTGRVRKVFDTPRHKGPVTAVDFGFRDTTIATGSNVGEVILYNCTTGQGFSPLQTPGRQTIKQLQFSRYKKSLLGAACDDGALYLWDTNSKILLRRFDAEAGAHRAPCTGLVFSPCNQMLIVSVGLDKSYICYDAVSNKIIKNISCDEPLTSVDLFNDGWTLAVGSSRGRVLVYDIRVMSVPFQTINAHHSAVSRVSFQRTAASFNKGSTSMTSSSTSIDKGVAKGAKLVNNNSQLAVSSETTLPKQQFANQHPSVVKAERSSSAITEVYQPAVPQSSNQEVSVPNLDDVFSPARDGGYLISSTSVSADKNHTSWNAGCSSSEKNNGGSTNCIAGELFSPLASAPSSRDKVSSSNLTFGVFSPSFYSTAPEYPSVLSPMKISEEDQPEKVVLQEVIEDAKSKLSLDEDTLVHRSVNGVMNINESDRTGGDRQASRVCFDSSRRSVKSSFSSYTTSPLNATAIHLPQSSSPVVDTLRLFPDKTDSYESVPALNLPPNAAQVSTDVLCHASADVQRSLPAETISRHDLPLVGKNFEGAAGDSQNVTLHPYLIELVRNTVRDEVEECEERIHRTLLHIHVDMLRQFHLHQVQTQAMLKEYSINEDLLSEIVQLRAENARLKMNY